MRAVRQLIASTAVAVGLLMQLTPTVAEASPAPGSDPSAADVEEQREPEPIPEPEVGSVEVTPHTETEYLGEGRYETTVAPEPIYRPEADGSMTQLDAEVVETADEVSAPEMLVPVEFGDGSDDSIMAFDVQGDPVTVRTLDLDPKPAEADGDAVVVDTTDPDVELRYDVTTATVKEEILIQTADAPREYRFRIEDPNGALGSPAPDGSGGYVFTGNGEISLEIPSAVAWPADAHGRRIPDPSLGLDPSAHLEVTPVSDGFDVRVWLDEAWLAGKQFPIVLDPTYSWAWGRVGWRTNGAGAIYVKNVGRNEACGATKEICLAPFDYGALYAGSVNTTSPARNWSALRSVLTWYYDEASAHHKNDLPGGAPFNVPQGGRILGAQLWLHHVGCIEPTYVGPGQNCGPGSTEKKLQVHRLNAFGLGTSPTWQSVNNAIVGPVSATVQGDSHGRAFRPLPSTFTGTDATYLADGPWQYLQIKDVVQGWVDNPSQGAALVIKNNDETIGNMGTSWWSAYSTANGQERYHPYLRVQWEETPPAAARNLTATITGNNKIAVDWDDPTASSAAGTTWPQGYKVMIRQAETDEDMLDEPIDVCACAASNHTFESLLPLPAGNYEATVTAYNLAGYAPVAVSNPVTSPGGIDLGFIFDATDASAEPEDGYAVLKWKAPVLEALVDYEVQAYEKIDQAWVPLGGPVAYPETLPQGHAYASLTNGHTYRFTVRSVAALGLLKGALSTTNEVVPYGPPFAPENLTPVAGDRTAAITWTHPSDRGDVPGTNGRAMDNYTVRLYVIDDDDPATPDTLVDAATVGADDELRAAFDFLANGADYYFTVQGSNIEGDDGEIATSSTVTPAGQPFPPVNVTASITQEGVLVEWDPAPDQAGAPGDNGSPVRYYTVTATPGDMHASTTSGQDTDVVMSQGFTAGETYSFRVTATNGVDASDPSAAFELLLECGGQEPPAQGFFMMAAGDPHSALPWLGECDPALEPQCDNGDDDDGDDLEDLDDPDCGSAGDWWEGTEPAECDNGLDDDNDDLEDGDDPGCDGPTDPDEYNPPNPSAPPTASRTFYIDNDPHAADVAALARSEAANSTGADVVILAVGEQLPIGSSGFGNELSYEKLKDLAINYVEAYYNGTGNPGDGAPLNRRLWLALGTVNSNYANDGDAAAKGARWAQLIADIEAELDPIYYRAMIVGANDFEPGPEFGGAAPNGPRRARAWLTAYGNAPGGQPYMSFGSADGCRPFPEDTQLCDHDWTREDYWFLSTGISSAVGAAPQIYSQSQGAQWVAIAEDGYVNHDGRILRFLASLTQADACRTRPTDPTCVAGADNTPAEGWTKLRTALDGAPNVNQALGFATDIGWLGDQD